jgi:hypothetical protein
MNIKNIIFILSIFLVEATSFAASVRIYNTSDQDKVFYVYRGKKFKEIKKDVKAFDDLRYSNIVYSIPFISVKPLPRDIKDKIESYRDDKITYSLLQDIILRYVLDNPNQAIYLGIRLGAHHKVKFENNKIVELIDDEYTKLTPWKTPDPSLKYHEACWLTAHNAYAAKKYGFAYAQQDETITDQLNMGIRGLMLDVSAARYNPDENKIYNDRADFSRGTKFTDKEKEEFVKVNPLLYKSIKKGGNIGLNSSELNFLEQENLKPLFLDLKNKIRNYLNNMKLLCWHGALKIGSDVQLEFEYVCEEIKRFLNNNPTEIVTIFLENWADNISVDLEFERIFGNLILKPRDWDPYKENGWPTLKWMQDNNKRIVIFNWRKSPTLESEKYGKGGAKINTECMYYTWNYCIENQYGTYDIEDATNEMYQGKHALEPDSAGTGLELGIGKERYLMVTNFFAKMTPHSVSEYNTKDLRRLISKIKNEGLYVPPMRDRRYVGKYPNFIGLDLISRVKPEDKKTYGDPMLFVNTINKQQVTTNKN